MACQEELTLLQVVPLSSLFFSCIFDSVRVSYAVVHHLYVIIWLPLLAGDKVSVKSINSRETLLSEMGLTLQFQL